MADEEPGPSPDELAILGELEKKILWLATWTIHHANHIRESVDGLKVGERVVSQGAYELKLSTATGAIPEHGHQH